MNEIAIIVGADMTSYLKDHNICLKNLNCTLNSGSVGYIWVFSSHCSYRHTAAGSGGFLHSLNKSASVF